MAQSESDEQLEGAAARMSETLHGDPTMFDEEFAYALMRMGIRGYKADRAAYTRVLRQLQVQLNAMYGTPVHVQLNAVYGTPCPDASPK